MRREVSCLFCVSEVMTSLVTSYIWKAIDCEINSAALFYDNCLASDCFVTYGPVSIKLINVFKIGGTLNSSSSLFFILNSLGTLSTSELLKHIRFCIACNIQGLPNVFC